MGPYAGRINIAGTHELRENIIEFLWSTNSEYFIEKKLKSHESIRPGQWSIANIVRPFNSLHKEKLKLIKTKRPQLLSMNYKYEIYLYSLLNKSFIAEG